MSLHTVSGRWQLGLLLAFATASFWATLPVALKGVLGALDALTVTWFRFAFAALGMGLWLASRRGFAPLARLAPRHWGLLLLAGATLIGNYVFYLFGLDRTSPGNAQLLIQLAPLLMALGGIFVFGERFSLGQWLGLLLVTGGLGLFFADQLGRQADAGAYGTGAALIVLAALVWAIYALLQKQLLRQLGSQTILWCIYLLAAVVLLPFAEPARLWTLSSTQWWLLVYCAFNTLAAYGAFAEALAHWEASRVSVVLALTPLLTLVTVEVAHRLAPVWVSPESIGLLGGLGAALVVGGSILTSLLGRRRV
ncbi:DMT family transporter [Pseudomarimonas salicorniae]|uniref:DMT family transporter n=1 Tax=Pseudomarimonas salicorniae TaxID=2933270 RepID=A0ABT0GDJ3_9GAMM|nr:DMT family transporter [Lysobacter sp. CAU 1642]MCK7592412.1 DMT family transporter [Lysobacter sp. CAU 1642]